MSPAKLPSVRLRPGREARVRAGHLWIYEGEIAAVDGGSAPGGIVDVLDAGGRFLGRGYYNPASQIRVRILARERVSIDEGFFAGRLRDALAYRTRCRPGAAAARLVHSEADLLPGLIVDRYGEYLVLQILTLGMEVRRDLLLNLLAAEIAPRGMLERSEGASRAHEGLPPRVGPCYGEIPEEEILVREGEAAYHVDLRTGQKTGFFLDQRENRRAAAEYAAGRRVLDCFCHSGMFGIAAARAGAASVVGVDRDDAALVLAGRNAALNGVADRCRFVAANAFDFLRAADEAGERFELIILDPPAFTKSKSRVEQALRGYKEINLRACRLLSPGGILVTCSCSYHVSPALFEEIVREAARDAGRLLRLLERRGQAPDHPVLLGLPETEYLKCLILEVLP